MTRKLTICTPLSGLALAAPAHAATLTAVGDSARWSDSISNASAPHPAACTPLTCRSYDLDLALPPRATQHNNEAMACVEFHGAEASTCRAGP